tara:strand:+ start:487 stop:615 length:129 start_codon:yes stop_codon:yes gene_type:complete
VDLPTLENMCVSEKIISNYAKIIAEEDIEEAYGKEIILYEGI